MVVENGDSPPGLIYSRTIPPCTKITAGRQYLHRLNPGIRGPPTRPEDLQLEESKFARYGEKAT